MASIYNKVDWLAMEGLRVLLNKLVIAENFNTDYSKDFKKSFAVGEQVRIPKPQRWFVTDGVTFQPQDKDRPHTTVTIDQIPGIHFEDSTLDIALHMERGEEEFSKQYLEPAMTQLAQEIDSRAALYAHQRINNVVGTLGTNPTTINIATQARSRLIENSCPADGDKRMILTPDTMGSFADLTTTIFQPSDQISRAFKEGSLGRAKGFDWYESMSLYQHIAGTWAGAVTVTSAAATGISQIAVTATAADTFKVGDRFTIAGVYNVNPSTRRSTGKLKRFVVTEDMTAAGGGADVLKFSPTIEGPGSHYQNVDSLPAASAALTLWPDTTTPNGKTGMVGMALHRNAFAMVSVPLTIPKRAEMASYKRDPKTGIGIAFIRDWDNIERRYTNRFDCLFGFGDLYPDNCAVAVASGT